MRFCSISEDVQGWDMESRDRGGDSFGVGRGGAIAGAYVLGSDRGRGGAECGA